MGKDFIAVSKKNTEVDNGAIQIKKGDRFPARDYATDFFEHIVAAGDDLGTVFVELGEGKIIAFSELPDAEGRSIHADFDLEEIQ